MSTATTKRKHPSQRKANMCSVCRSGHALAVDRSIAAGHGVARIARRFSQLTERSIARHRAHAAKFITPTPPAANTELEAWYQGLDADLARLQASAELQERTGHAIAAIAARAALRRTYAELEGKLPGGNGGGNVNFTLFDQATLEKIALAYAERLRRRQLQEGAPSAAQTIEGK